MGGVTQHVVYECGICGHVHPWDWNGDCRDDENRYVGADGYAEAHGVSEDDVEVRSMTDRVRADNGEEGGEFDAEYDEEED